MKTIVLFVLIIGLFSCQQSPGKSSVLQNRIDSLERKLAECYKPGFGEFMSGIQAHHSKLWFAGQNQNWKLADFEVHEIREGIENIQKYQKERTESQSINVINPALDSVIQAIDQKNPILFKTSFINLTNTCNSCHRSTNFGFNMVKIPDHSPYSNQDFKVNDSK